MTHAEKCSRAAEIVRERGSIELFGLDDGGDVAIFGPELGNVLAIAADECGELAEAVVTLAEAVLFAVGEL